MAYPFSRPFSGLVSKNGCGLILPNWGAGEMKYGIGFMARGGQECPPYKVKISIQFADPDVAEA
jgi:hypothetical protein